MPLMNNPGGTAAASQGGGIQRPGYKPPVPPVAPAPPTAPFAPNPAGFTTTQNNGAMPTNPTGSTGSGYVPGNFSQTPGMAPTPGVSPTGVTWSTDPTGKATPYTPYSNPGGETFWRPGEGTDLYQLGTDRFLALLRSLKGEGLGGPVSMNREPGLTLTPRETPSTMADRTAAESAAFGRAKDRTGKVGKSAIDSLRDKASSMGMAGSTAEARGVADVTNAAQGQLGEVIRQQAEDQLDRADTIDDRNLTAGIAQRGQDIGQRTTDYGGNIQQRGQDFQGAMNNPQQQMMMQLLSSFYGGGAGGFMPGMPRY